MKFYKALHALCSALTQRIPAVLTVIVVCVAIPAQAGTIVRISTTYGDFSVETLDSAAPATVQNFLHYVNSGHFNGTFIHRVESGFVVQGGGFRFQPFIGPVEVPQNPPVVNEFNVSNTRGTLAMAKQDGLPNSATSQWFVNLADNSATLDPQNGGFTVFAQVLGDGMTAVDAIAANPVFNLGTAFGATPLRADIAGSLTSPASVTASHFITMNALVTQRYSSALHVFESTSGRLITSVDGGTLGAYSLNLSLVADAPEIVFQLNPDSMVPLSIRPIGMSTYSASDNRLRIPSIEINANGSLSNITNAVLVLSDPVLQRFTLESYNQ